MFRYKLELHDRRRHPEKYTAAAVSCPGAMHAKESISNAAGSAAAVTVGERGVVAQQPTAREAAGRGYVADTVLDVPIVGEMSYAHPSHGVVHIQSVSHV
jgi:hypothetical protein